MSNRLRAVRGAAFPLLMAAGAAMITASSLVYFDASEVPAFVIEKLPVAHEALWLASLHVHVAAALISFPLCIVLVTRALQRRPRLHRALGRLAGVLVLGGLVPSGAVLALDAKGGTAVAAGFLLSGALVTVFMIHGVLAVRRGDLRSHRRAMLQVFAQMSVAVTSRTLLVGLDVLGVEPGLAYVVALWAPVLGSAFAAEVLAQGSLVRTIERMVHGTSTLVRSIRPGSRVRSLARSGR